MNAQLKNEPDLSLPLPAHYPETRRRRVGNVVLDDDAVARFNRLLTDIAGASPTVSTDQLVTLARWLQAQPRSLGIAVLSERLARAEYLKRMLADNDWELPPALRERARMLIDYLRQVDDLIPDETPLVGHLDDALLIELSWSAFAGEAQDYQDYCRFRVEQRPRGNTAERRIAWENAVLAQANDLLQRRRVAESHYANTDLHRSLFRVC